MPDTESIVAKAVLLLLQVPPAILSLNVVVNPRHTLGVPIIGGGNGSTVCSLMAVQPVGKV